MGQVYIYKYHYPSLDSLYISNYPSIVFSIFFKLTIYKIIFHLKTLIKHILIGSYLIRLLLSRFFDFYIIIISLD